MALFRHSSARVTAIVFPAELGMLSTAERGLLVPEDERKAKDVQQDVEDTLARAAALIEQSKREVERSQRIVKETDAKRDEANLGAGEEQAGPRTP